MSNIGRIFIVLNLVLSAAFLGWALNALSTSQDLTKALSEEKAAHAAAVQAKEAELSKLQVDLNGVMEQSRTTREQRDGLTAEVDRQKTQLEELKRANDAMQGNLTKIQSTLGDYNNTITQLTTQKDAATERAHEAERARDAALQEKQDAELAKSQAEEATNTANTQIADLNTEKTSLTDRLSELETRMQIIVQQYGVNLSEIDSAPSISAMVLDVNKELNFVVINKGSKDGVKAGYTFEIYRGQQYKGQVRIQDVQEGMSSGLIVSEKTPIARGDQAATRL